MRALTLFCAAHLLAAVAGWSPAAVRRAGPDGFPGWPAELDGRPLGALALTEREAELARDFPGRVGRFTDGTAEVVLRWVRTPTRQLHPAADCLRGAGWAVAPGPVRVDARGRAWGSTCATRGGVALEITERIADAAGQSWPDASSWYWASLLGRTRGPWWAISVARTTR